MSITNLRFEIADQDYDCNACEHIKDNIEEYKKDCGFSTGELQALELAEKNNWKVKKGEMCRRYIWDEGGDEECECVEIPAIAKLNTEHDLWINC